MDENEFKNRQVVKNESSKNELLKNELLRNVELSRNRRKESKLPKEVQKQHLIDRFFDIGGALYLDELKDLERDLELFNLFVGDEDIESLILVIEMIKKNSQYIERYYLSVEFNDLFVKLLKKDEMTFFEIRVLSTMFMASHSPNELFQVMAHILQQIENYQIEPEYARVKFFIYQNASDMTMHFNISNDEYNEKLIEYLNKALDLTEEYKNDMWKLFTRLKLGIVLKDVTMIDFNLKQLQALNSNAVDNHVQIILEQYNVNIN